MIEIFGKDRRRQAFFALFVLSSVVCLVATSWHYNRKYPGNPLTWLAWLWSLFFLLAAYFPTRARIAEWAAGVWEDKRFLRWFGILALLFVVSHIWNFKTAPWNQNGLFDDAAWDIYFAKRYIFTDAPFQAAISEGIAREVGFHYYITCFFLLFGYDLLTFNVSLLLLGLTTFLFTCLIVHRLFGNYFVTIVSAVILNFLPLHFIETFVGHRYAMAAPLMTASLYFLMTGFSERSAFRVALSAILAALCVESAIMGKHFLLCLLGAAILWAITDYKRTLTKEKVGFAIVFVLALVAALMPMIVFVYYYRTVYFGHERNLTDLFLQGWKNRAAGGLQPYINDLRDIFFAPVSFRRLAMQDHVIFPFWYYALLVPGMAIALFKRRFDFLLLSIVPVVGAFISTAYDFRVLHAVPFWIVLMAYPLHALTRLEKLTQSYLINLGAFAIAAAVVAAGLIPSMRYLYEKSKFPYSIHLLGQQDVAAGRFIRGIVAGEPHPTTRRTPNEFLRVRGLPVPTYDALVCNESGFAVTHLFLQDYGDRSIMSFCDQVPMIHFTEASLFAMNKKVLANFKGEKDVMLVWQESAKSYPVINAFQKLNHLGRDRRLGGKHAGREYLFYVLTIPKENIERFKQELANLNL